MLDIHCELKSAYLSPIDNSDKKVNPYFKINDAPHNSVQKNLIKNNSFVSHVCVVSDFHICSYHY